jgi:hypothetical protein
MCPLWLSKEVPQDAREAVCDSATGALLASLPAKSSSP